MSGLRIAYRARNVAGTRQQAAELMGSLGRAMIALATIPALFIAIGLAMGSLFWLWWTLLQAMAGLTVVGVSAYAYARAARLGRTSQRPTAEEAEYAAENYQAHAA